MIKSFITSFKLKNTYRVNSVIYSIRQFPFVKKILPNTLYKNKVLKIIGNIISVIIELCSIFLGKFLYLWLCIVSIVGLYKTNQATTFIHIFTFLTLAGAFLNTYMFNPTKDKYYAMMIMNMDVKNYTLSNYCYAMIKVFVGFLPFTIIFGIIYNIPLFISLLMPLFVICAKMCFNAYTLIKYDKSNLVINENTLTKTFWIVIIGLVVFAYGLPYLGLSINYFIFIIIFLVSLVLSIYSFIIIKKFDKYKSLYKKLLTNENVYAVENNNSAKTIKENTVKQITLDTNFTSNKSGFAYFHELFVKRHSKILTKAIKKQSIFIAGVIIVAIFLVLTNKDLAKQINSILLVYLPYFVFIMYMLNRGTTLTQAMFMNCDHSMLTYRIYRTPKVILGLFKERLKTLVFINLIPAILIGFGLVILLYLTGGTDEVLNYLVLFISIIAMSIFFTVHYLVMYYLLQPYNINTEIKSSTYRVVQMITYFVCYFMIDQKISTLYFGMGTIIFSILYCFISLVIVYRYAPKTFKIRI